MMRFWPATLFALFGLAGVLSVRAQDGPAPSADEIVRRALHVAYRQGADARILAGMTITDRRGRERTREFVVLRRNNSPETPDGGQKYYVYFQEPADVRRMVFMVWTHTEGQDDRWLYLPALDSVQRIASAQKRTRFAGSNFFYEDISGRRLADDRHELVETTDTCYVIGSTPRDPRQAEFASFKTWMHKESFVTVRIEYYDQAGTVERLYEALKVETIQGNPTVTKGRMRDVKRQEETLLRYLKVQYDTGLPDDLFTERYLRSEPAGYLRW
jgi:hypothetical protein